MEKKKNPIHIIGIDAEGSCVVGGLFKMADTYGFPLSFSLVECESRGWCPGFAAFIEDAKKADWPLNLIIKRIREACFDSGMSTVWKHIEDKIFFLCR